ncbi:MAG: hypothetical protein M1820_002874 [Bogoriella megaspora]|nr:MAG: hypothetical protein M1820_002874 [Bogoriella megaspora]
MLKDISNPLTRSPRLALELSEIILDPGQMQMEIDDDTYFWYAAAMMSTYDVGLDMVVSIDRAGERLLASISSARTLRTALKALGSFAVLARNAIRSGWVTRRISQRLRNGPFNTYVIENHANFNDRIGITLPPSAMHIPCAQAFGIDFLSVPFDPGPPVCQRYRDRFLELLRQRNSVISDFFEDGEWHGFFSVPWPQSAFGDPMIDIKFKASFAEKAPFQLELRGSGFDSFGNFVLNGEALATQDRQEVRILKLYPANPTNDHSWRLFMTPFGLFGDYIDRVNTHNAPCGVVWLWKKKWKPCDEDSYRYEKYLRPQLDTSGG